MTLVEQIADTTKTNKQVKTVLDAIKTEMYNREDDTVTLPKSSIIDLCDLLMSISADSVKRCDKIVSIVNILYESSISTVDLNRILAVLEK
jgi:hypothetical protein